QQLHQQEPGPVLPVRLNDLVEGVDPLGRLLRIDIGDLVGEPVEDHAHSPPCSRRFGRPRTTSRDFGVPGRRKVARSRTVSPPCFTFRAMDPWTLAATQLGLL